jgi:hypothetical protein
MNDFFCPYCGVECATTMALVGHKPLCPSNPVNAPQIATPVDTKAPETNKRTAAPGTLDVEPVAKPRKPTPSARHQ